MYSQDFTKEQLDTKNPLVRQTVLDTLWIYFETDLDKATSQRHEGGQDG